MRRRADDWINATHILKVADYDKPARTRILEREVQKGTHEKVQGGYGKYQGQEALMKMLQAYLTLSQAHGSRWLTAVRSPRGMASSKNCSQSSTSFLVTEVLPQHQNMQPQSANPRQLDNLDNQLVNAPTNYIPQRSPLSS